MAANREDFEAMPQAACPMSVGEVDLFAPGAQEHWYDSYKLLQDGEPVLRLPGQGHEPGADAYVLTKYEDIRRVVRDPDLFPTRQGPGSSGTSKIHDEIFEEEGFGEVVTARNRLRPDIESHKLHREQLTEPWVGASGALQHRDMITAHANRLMDNWIDKGEVEFVTEFAAPLPQAVISTILGFPLEDMPVTKKWEEAQVRRFVYGFGPKSQMEDPDEEDNAKALVAFNRYIQEQIDEKRRNPKEDMITFLTNVEFQGSPLSDGDINQRGLGDAHRRERDDAVRTHIGGDAAGAAPGDRRGVAGGPLEGALLRGGGAAPLRAHAGALGPHGRARHGDPRGQYPGGVAAAPALGGGEPRPGAVRGAG